MRKGKQHIMLISILAGMLLCSCTAGASDDWDIPGNHGELEVSGSLREGVCQLDMRSEFQDVKMDSSALANLVHPGDTGRPVKLVLRLLGCQVARSPKAGKEEMPAVSFQSPSDPDEPSLLRMGGVTGIGLRILDEQGKQVLPGTRHKPQFSIEGGNVVVYTVLPVRTKAPLTTGDFVASVDFRMSYE